VPTNKSMLSWDAYERGVMDSYCGRGRACHPRYLVTPKDETVHMTAAEITAYTAGFDNNEQFGGKIYFTGHDEDEDEEQVKELEVKFDTSCKSDSKSGKIF
jgi:hypothetical protein